MSRTRFILTGNKVVAEQMITMRKSEVDKLVAERNALRALVDHAETLLCNATPMPHCDQTEWGEIITKWRDQKHAARAALGKETTT